MNRAVFLDRDGVLNKCFVVDGVPKPPKNINDVEIIVGVKEAVELLLKRSFVIVVVTNQPDVSRGTLDQETVETINEFLGHELGIEHFFTCYHDDFHGCDCRKPKPALLLRAAQDLNIDLSKSFMVGDRWRDIEAGQSAGCRCFFIDYKYREKSPVFPFVKVASLIEATHLIMENQDDAFS
jgi:D-glycero-D-manno-heptose 1,7-bisphosphate phosphatase